MKFWIAVAAAFVVSFGAVGAFRMPAASSTPEKSAEKPATDNAIDGLSRSDDFKQHGTVFQKTARELVDRGRCAEAEFKEYGGFVKSQNSKNEAVYFTYCGGWTIANRIYVTIDGDWYSLSPLIRTH
jgi:hypothetical protein